VAKKERTQQGGDQMAAVRERQKRRRPAPLSLNFQETLRDAQAKISISLCTKEEKTREKRQLAENALALIIWPVARKREMIFPSLSCFLSVTAQPKREALTHYPVRNQ